MKDWTHKPPTRAGWYWRVVRGEKPKPVAVAREDRPDEDPCITGVAVDMDCEHLSEDEDVLWSSKPFSAPKVPKWPTESEARP